MCDQSECGDSCRLVSGVSAAGGGLLASALVYQVLPAVVLAAGVVAGAGVLAGGGALLVLRRRRRRPVLSGRVLRRVGVTAVGIPAVSVPLAIVTGAPLFAPAAMVAGMVILVHVVRRVVSAQVVYVHPALLAARARPAVPAAKRGQEWLPAAVLPGAPGDRARLAGDHSTPLEPTRVIPARVNEEVRAWAGQ